MAFSDLSTPKLMNIPTKTNVLIGGTTADLKFPLDEKLYP